MQMESQVVQVNIDDIIPNRFQPRIAFDEKGLAELAASIKEHGIIQPLVLRKLGKKYEIIAGERRYKASTLAGLQTVPAVISNIDDNKSAEVALVENIQRRDLTPIEEARSYKNLLDKGYLTQEQLAKKMGLSQSAISNKLRLLNLDDRVQQALLENKISERHARSLLTLNDREDQKKFLDRIISERLTVRQLDQEIKKYLDNDDNNNSGNVPLVDLTPNIEEIKQTATDINNNKPKNIANLMVSEDTMTEYSNNLPNNLNEAQPVTQENTPSVTTTLDENISSAPTSIFNNILNSNSINTDNKVESSSSNSNKFFNQLEEEPADLNNLNPFSSQPSFNNDSNLISPVDEEIEIFDMPVIPSNKEENISTPLEVKDNVMHEQSVSLNPNNKFFTPVVNNVIDEEPVVKEVQEEIINPMDFIGKIEEEPSTIQEYTIVDAITEIRDLIKILNNKGLKLTVDEAGVDNKYQMNITIEKE